MDGWIQRGFFSPYSTFTVCAGLHLFITSPPCCFPSLEFCAIMNEASFKLGTSKLPFLLPNEHNIALRPQLNFISLSKDRGANVSHVVL